MTRQPRIEERPWWPDALRLFEELAETGTSVHKATQVVGKTVGGSYVTLRQAIMRGSVPSYPPRDLARAAAWQAGEPRYVGVICPHHGTRERYSNDGLCVECMDEWRAGKKRDAAN